MSGFGLDCATSSLVTTKANASRMPARSSRAVASDRMVDVATQQGMSRSRKNARSSGMPGFTGTPSRFIRSISRIRDVSAISSAG